MIDDFTAATRQQAHASVELLSARLDALDQDTRMLSDLVTSSRGGAAVVLRAVTWTPLPAAHLLVTDPAGVVWAGCETADGCRVKSPDSGATDSQLGPPAARQIGARGTMIVRSPRLPAVQVSERVD